MLMRRYSYGEDINRVPPVVLLGARRAATSGKRPRAIERAIYVPRDAGVYPASRLSSSFPFLPLALLRMKARAFVVALLRGCRETALEIKWATRSSDKSPVFPLRLKKKKKKKKNRFDLISMRVQTRRRHADNDVLECAHAGLRASFLSLQASFSNEDALEGTAKEKKASICLLRWSKRYAMRRVNRIRSR